MNLLTTTALWWSSNFPEIPGISCRRSRGKVLKILSFTKPHRHFNVTLLHSGIRVVVARPRRPEFEYSLGFQKSVRTSSISLFRTAVLTFGIWTNSPEFSKDHLKFHGFFGSCSWESNNHKRCGYFHGISSGWDATDSYGSAESHHVADSCRRPGGETVHRCLRCPRFQRLGAGHQQHKRADGLFSEWKHQPDRSGRRQRRRSCS